MQEIVALPQTVQLPGQPEILEGFLNLRGTVLPVVRTAVLFRQPPHAGLYSPIIVIRGAHGDVGLLVDEVRSVEDIAEQWRPLAPGHSANEFALGEFVCDGENTILLDSARLLLVEEQQRLQQLQAELTRRRHSLEVNG